MNEMLYRNTPEVVVRDNRGLTLREIRYHRHPSTLSQTDERITRHHYNAAGYLTQSIDPRLFQAQQDATNTAPTGQTLPSSAIKPNIISLTTLTGQVLHTESVDAGTSVALHDIAQRPMWTRTTTGMVRTWQYEAWPLPGRLLSITEEAQGEPAQITERFVWAGSSPAEQDHNLAGTCTHHYDPAGLTQTNSIALTGTPLSVSRQLISDTLEANWVGTDPTPWQAQLDPALWITQSTTDTTGSLLTQTDAKGNRQRLTYDVAGMLNASWLMMAARSPVASPAATQSVVGKPSSVQPLTAQQAVNQTDAVQRDAIQQVAEHTGAAPNNGPREQTIIAALTYSATGQKQREVHGNGIITTYQYEPQTQRLIGIKTGRPAGHAAGAKVLQDLRYAYDPVGNVVNVQNKAEETRFWRNQKVVPENTYRYDSLYQLVHATGRELASIVREGLTQPAPQIPLPQDASAYTGYTRDYTYDRGGNLTRMQHRAPATGNHYTQEMTVSPTSNRAVLSTLTKEPTQVEKWFDAAGQQRALQPGQPLAWTARGQLRIVKLVDRKAGAVANATSADTPSGDAASETTTARMPTASHASSGDATLSAAAAAPPIANSMAYADDETYRYDADNQRVIKHRRWQTRISTCSQQVIYLPGLELRTTHYGDTLHESLHMLRLSVGGRAQVQVLHWAAGPPPEIPNNQVRLCYDDLVGNNSLELDNDGQVISQEEYYPYGGTAVWTARNRIEADYKTIHYSGKERDATGLYYYGYRYYQPWAGRWLSADPTGTIDGLNLYAMVKNNPITLYDLQGHFSEDNSNAYLASALSIITIGILSYLFIETYVYTINDAIWNFTLRIRGVAATSTSSVSDQSRPKRKTRRERYHAFEKSQQDSGHSSAEATERSSTPTRVETATSATLHQAASPEAAAAHRTARAESSTSTKDSVSGDTDHHARPLFKKQIRKHRTTKATLLKQKIAEQSTLSQQAPQRPVFYTHILESQMTTFNDSQNKAFRGAVENLQLNRVAGDHEIEIRDIASKNERDFALDMYKLHDSLKKTLISHDVTPFGDTGRGRWRLLYRNFQDENASVNAISLFGIYNTHAKPYARF